jgi:hypothetical protein
MRGWTPARRVCGSKSGVNPTGAQALKVSRWAIGKVPKEALGSHAITARSTVVDFTPSVRQMTWPTLMGRHILSFARAQEAARKWFAA